jgi:small subunit ribosomal protein S1
MSAETPTPSSIDELSPRMELRGKVKRIELYGAFVDIGIGQDALLHISQLGQKNVRNVGDVVKEGEDVTVYVLKVDKAEKRVALSLVQPPAFTWDDLKEGQVLQGTVTRIESYGVFVDIGAERPAMIHVSELAEGFVKSPADVVKVGEQIEARILKINRKNRQIDMTRKEAQPVIEDIEDEEEDDEVPTAMALALRRAMQSEGGGKNAKQNAKDRKAGKRSQEQEDLIARTLREHSN